MTQINGLSAAVYPVAQPRRALAPAQRSAQLWEQPHKPSPSVLPTSTGESLRERLDARAIVLGRESGSSHLPPRTREAIAVYRSTKTDEERDHISRLLGVDEYA